MLVSTVPDVEYPNRVVMSQASVKPLPSVVALPTVATSVTVQEPEFVTSGHVPDVSTTVVVTL